MKLVDLGDLRISRAVAAAMRKGAFDTAPYLFAHQQGSAGDVSDGEEMLANVGRVLQGRGAQSRHATGRGILRIETTTIPETFLSFEHEEKTDKSLSCFSA